MNGFDEQELSKALLPANVIFNRGKMYSVTTRPFQGIPSIERTKGGIIYVAYYGGGKDEGCGNYVILTRSTDGIIWSDYAVIIPPSEQTRCFDPCLWIDDAGALHIFYAQSYRIGDGRMGVWDIVCDNPDADCPTLNKPYRIANGVMMNKPIIRSTGEWLYTCAIYENWQDRFVDIPEERFSNVFRSDDRGLTLRKIGHTDFKDRLIDEHMIVELRDGRLWMLIRGLNGIAESFSSDGGVTWTQPQYGSLGGPSSRFCIRRLCCGDLLLINHHDFTARNNLKAMISRDEGKTWEGFLMLDERDRVSYPDMTEDEEGNIYITYDRDRYGDRDILLAIVTREDILAGRIVNPHSVLKRIISTGRTATV